MEEITGFMSLYSQLLVTADQDNGGLIIANRSAWKEWEKFRFQKLAEGVYAIQNDYSKLYLTTFDSDLPSFHFLAASEGAVNDDRQKFQLHIIEPRVLGNVGKFALMSMSSRKWVTADQDNGGTLSATRNVIREWEEFRFFDNSLDQGPHPRTITSGKPLDIKALDLTHTQHRKRT